MKGKITETIYYEVKATKEEMIQVVTGNSIVPIAKLLDRYNKTKNIYTNNGYTIVKEDKEKLTFVAEKKYEED